MRKLKMRTVAQCVLFAIEMADDLKECATMEDAALVFGKAFGVTRRQVAAMLKRPVSQVIGLARCPIQVS